MDEQNKEVKETFVKNEDGDEIVNPELLDNEKDTLSDSSPEDKPDDIESDVVETEEESEESTEELEDVVDEPVQPPKEVEGETPRERAFRLEIEKLRKANRKAKRDSLFGELEEEPVKPVSKPDEPEDDFTSKYDKTELDNFRQLLVKEADKLGFVKKGDIEKSSYDDTLDDFLTSHKEYLPENDPDNILWDKFREEFTLYKRPNNSRNLKKLLDRVHNGIINSGNGLNSAKVSAQQSKLKQASHGGTTIAKKTKTNSGVDPNLRVDMLKGFTPDELDELVK